MRKNALWSQWCILIIFNSLLLTSTFFITLWFIYDLYLHHPCTATLFSQKFQYPTYPWGNTLLLNGPNIWYIQHFFASEEPLIHLLRHSITNLLPTSLSRFFSTLNSVTKWWFNWHVLTRCFHLVGGQCNIYGCNDKAVSKNYWYQWQHFQ